MDQALHAAERETVDAGVVCAACGYSLSGLASGSSCPECGLCEGGPGFPLSLPGRDRVRVLAARKGAWVQIFGAAAFLEWSPLMKHSARRTTDPRCAACGYSLEGLAREASCPECGMAVAESIRGDRFGPAEHDYLERLALGARLAAWASLGWLAPVIAFLVHLFSPGRAPALAGITWFTLSRFVSVAAWWLLTGPRPSDVAARQTLFLRWRIRVWRMGALGVWLTAVAAGHDPIAAAMMRSAGSWALLAWALFVTASLWDSVALVAHLMDRAGAWDQAPRPRDWRAAVVIWYVAFVIGGIATNGCLVLPIAVLLPFAWIWYLVTLSRLAQNLGWTLRILRYRLEAPEEERDTSDVNGS